LNGEAADLLKHNKEEYVRKVLERTPKAAPKATKTAKSSKAKPAATATDVAAAEKD
jgi:hypothetical protein